MAVRSLLLREAQQNLRRNSLEHGIQLGRSGCEDRLPLWLAGVVCGGVRIVSDVLQVRLVNQVAQPNRVNRDLIRGTHLGGQLLRTIRCIGGNVDCVELIALSWLLYGKS